MSSVAPHRDAILGVLEEFGPMTVEEIATELRVPERIIRSRIASTRYEHPGKFFIISGYEFRPRRGREVRVYAAGPGVDARRPPVKRIRAAARRRNAEKATGLYWARAQAQSGEAPNPYLQLIQK